jgi:hypothetical protein
MLSLKDLVHKGIFLGRTVLIDTANQEKSLCGSKIKREHCRFMKYPEFIPIIFFDSFFYFMRLILQRDPNTLTRRNQHETPESTYHFSSCPHGSHVG